MRSGLLHAKFSPSQWSSTGFPSHFCGLSRSQGWRVCSGSGRNVNLTSHFLTQLQCATSVMHNMTLKIWALFNACRPPAPFVLLKFSAELQLSPSLHISLWFALSCSVTRSQPSAPLLCISPWDEKQLLLPAEPRTAGLSGNLSTPSYPPSLQPLPLNFTFARTLGSHELHTKTILEKSIACIRASWAHLTVSVPLRTEELCSRRHPPSTPACAQCFGAPLSYVLALASFAVFMTMFGNPAGKMDRK